MNKVLIILKGVSRFAPPRCGKFIFSPKFNKFIFNGEPVSFDEFNKVFSGLVYNYSNGHLRTSNKHVTAEIIQDDVVEAKKDKPVVKAVEVEVNSEPKNEHATEAYRKHRGAGKFDVFDQSGKRVAELIKKGEAEQLVSKLNSTK